MTPVEMAALHRLCFAVPRPWSAAEFSDLLISPHVFALTESGAFALGRAVAGEAELMTLAVDPGLRRQGCGGRLVQRFLRTAKDQGAERAFLEVIPDNTAAVSLYLQAGFAVCGRRKGYYHPASGPAMDALVMDRAL